MKQLSKYKIRHKLDLFDKDVADYTYFFIKTIKDKLNVLDFLDKKSYYDWQYTMVIKTKDKRYSYSLKGLDAIIRTFKNLYNFDAKLKRFQRIDDTYVYTFEIGTKISLVNLVF